MDNVRWGEGVDRGGSICSNEAEIDGMLASAR